MLPNRYTMELELHVDHVDLSERVTLASIMNAMQVIADRHADQLGVGKEYVGAKGFYWIIARMRIHMLEYPVYGDTIVVQTWPGLQERIAFPRFFRFMTREGKLLGNSTTLYMLLDAQNHSIVSPSKAKVFPENFTPYSETNPMPEKIRFIPQGDPVMLRKPSYSDIDVNKHMNNARYAQWICDLFPTSRYADARMKHLQINFISDGLEGHKIALYLDDNGTTFSVCGMDIDADNRMVFSSNGEWTV